MSITEKELAEKVTAVYHEGSDLEAIMRNIASTAAELLGVNLTPEKPEPGLYFYGGSAVWIGPANATMLYLDKSENVLPWGNYDPTKLTPARVIPEAELDDAEARVVPAEPVELSKEEVGELWDANRDNAQWPWTSRRPTMWRVVTATVNAALAKYGHGGRTVNRGDARRVVDGAVNNAAGITERERITDAVMDLLGGGDDE